MPEGAMPSSETLRHLDIPVLLQAPGFHVDDALRTRMQMVAQVAQIRNLSVSDANKFIDEHPEVSLADDCTAVKPALWLGRLTNQIEGATGDVFSLSHDTTFTEIEHWKKEVDVADQIEVYKLKLKAEPRVKAITYALKARRNDSAETSLDHARTVAQIEKALLSENLYLSSYSCDGKGLYGQNILQTMLPPGGTYFKVAHFVGLCQQISIFLDEQYLIIIILINL